MILISTKTRHAPYNVWSSKHPPAGCTLDGNVIVTCKKDTLLLRVASPSLRNKRSQVCNFFPSSMCGEFFFFFTRAEQVFFFFPCGSSFFSFHVWVKFFFLFYLWVGQVFFFFFFFFTKTSCSPPLKSNGASLSGLVLRSSWNYPNVVKWPWTIEQTYKYCITQQFYCVNRKWAIVLLLTHGNTHGYSYLWLGLLGNDWCIVYNTTSYWKNLHVEFKCSI